MQGGQLPKAGVVRWSLQLQCKLLGDGHEGRASFANKLNGVCGAGAVRHLGGLHASELTVVETNINGFSELA